jgi:PAS domain S-box-containing protein
MTEQSITRTRLKIAGGVLALIAVYVGAGRFGLSLAVLNQSASAVWPPTGIALATLLLWGHRLWPAIFVGAFIVNIVTPWPAQTTLALALVKAGGMALGNTLEALVGAWLVRRFAGGVKAFDRSRNVFKFIALAVVFSTAISATFGVVTLCLTHHAAWAESLPIWFTWWMGDMVGAMVVAPLIIILLGGYHFRRWSPWQWLEAAGLLLVIAALGHSIMLGNLPSVAIHQLKYFALLPLLWAAMRFGAHGAITSVFLMGALALWGTIQGVGPFVVGHANTSLLFLQAFLGTMTVTALLIAAVMSERKQTEQRLQVQEAVSRVLAEVPTLKEASPKIIGALCEMTGWDVGAVWNVDRATNELFCVEVWHMPSVAATDFVTGTRQSRFRRGVGMPGRVWASGKPAWVPDVTRDSNFPRSPMALKENLHAAFCFPIRVGEEIVGAVECFSREVREPNDNFLEMLPALGNQIGQVIERRKAEEALRVKEAQLRLITGITAVMLTQCSRDLRYTFVNRAYAEMLGIPPEQIIGKQIVEVLGAEAFETIRPYIERVLCDEPVNYETEVPYSRIGRRFMHVIYVPEKDENGTVVGWVGSINDITDRKRVELQHRRMEALKGAILDSALDGIISIDHQGRIIDFNAAAEKIFGYARGEALGQPLAELIVPHRLRDQHQHGFARYMATGESRVLGKRIEMAALRRDGTEIPVELSINAIQLDGQRAFTATLRDITEQKKTQAALDDAQAKLKAHATDLEKTVTERTQELRETIAEVESFSYSISHDMRGPLRAMQGYASVLERELKGKMTDEESGYLSRIVAAASRLNSLVQDILSYSQVARTRLQLAPIDLQPLMLELIQQNPNLQPPLAEVRIEGPLPIVLAHEAAMMQICSNLLGNAVKFAYPGTTPLVRVWSHQHHGRVRIWIADNGIGIEPKNHERIFQMFERVNSPKDYEGTGIGLAIVKKAVERMGGQVGVESELGSGARFWFELRGASSP